MDNGPSLRRRPPALAQAIAGRGTPVAAKRRNPPARAGARRDYAEKLTILAIWNLLLAGLVAEVTGTTEIFSTGFYTFHIVDPLVILSSSAAMLYLVRGGFRADLMMLAALVIATLILCNLARGLGTGATPALLNFRANGAIGTILLMAVVMRPTSAIVRTAERALVWAAAALCVLIALRFIFGPLLFIRLTNISADAINDGGRPVSQVGAFIMVFAEAVLLSRVVRTGRIMRRGGWLTLLLPPMILLTGQGTALIAALLVLSLVFAIERGPFLQPRIAITLSGAAAAAILIATNLSKLASNATVLHRADNLGTRRMVWEGLTALWPKLPATIQLFGYPDGEAPPIFTYQNARWRLWENSMHSMYFGALPMMGYIGFIAFFSLMAMLLWSLAPIGRRRRALLPAYPFALCVAILVLSVSYEIRNETLIAVLIPIWWMRASRAAFVVAASRRAVGPITSQRLGSLPPRGVGPLAPSDVAEF